MDSRTIIFIHEYLTECFAQSEDPISPPGVKDITTVESAAGRPTSSAGQKDAYPTVFLKAASLFHSIAGNHSFHNGNKRTALLSTMYFLSEYGYLLDRCSDDELYEYTRKIAAHEITNNRDREVSKIAEWLEKHCRKEMRGEKPMKLGELRATLADFGYTLQDRGKTIDIFRNGKFQINILKKGAQGFEDYDPPYIAKIRKELRLTPEQGIDSARFYGLPMIKTQLGKFMEMRLEVMKKLAKT